MATISNSHIIQTNTHICVILLFSAFSFNRRRQESTDRLNKAYLRWAFVPLYAYTIVMKTKLKIQRNSLDTSSTERVRSYPPFWPIGLALKNWGAFSACKVRHLSAAITLEQKCRTRETKCLPSTMSSSSWTQPPSDISSPWNQPFSSSRSVNSKDYIDLRQNLLSINCKFMAYQH